MNKSQNLPATSSSLKRSNSASSNSLQPDSQDEPRAATWRSPATNVSSSLSQPQPGGTAETLPSGTDHTDLADTSNMSGSFDSKLSPTVHGLNRSATVLNRGSAFDGSAASSTLAGGVKGRHSISEESDTTVRENISPSLEAAFNSPSSAGPQTTSTASTESARTVRATAAFTPGQTTARTPSYPFPYVPSVSSKHGSTPLHQPFIALSPTASSSDVRPSIRPHEKFKSQESTGLSQVQSMTPRGGDEQPAFQIPTPNLYDLILQINSELAIDSWWSCLINIMHDAYKVDRMSVALPVDHTDVEGVPWGQKLSYDVNGLKDHLSSTDPSWSTQSTASIISDPSENSPVARRGQSRPPIETRHSYAGYETTRLADTDSLSKRPTSVSRPAAFRRVTAQTPLPNPSSLSPAQKLTFENLPLHQGHPNEYESSESQNALENSQEELYAKVFTNLRPLDREPDALLEPAGVNRVLERGSMVLLTRSFSEDEEDSAGKPLPLSQEEKQSQIFTPSRKSSLVEDPRPESKTSVLYEDYEQALVSPWSQSPAPSPAIQNDPEENPFFASASVNESSFEPVSPREDYSAYQSIEAIGIDNAYTVIHIPLIHPSLSKVAPTEHRGPANISRGELDKSREEYQHSMEKKIPIAILSVSSPHVPYHSNLIESLRDLAPHLATSFNTCLRNTNIQDRIHRALRNKHPSDHFFELAPRGLGLSSDMGLESLLQYDHDDRSSTMESVTSPSDYSGFSGQSPMGSISSTPAQESAPQSSNNRSTPVESGGGYFEGHNKRSSSERSRTSNVVSQSQTKSPNTGRLSSWDHRSVLQRIDSSSVGGEGSSSKRKTEQKRTKNKETKQSAQTKTSAKSRRQSTGQQEIEEPKHSLLHSHGADFKASFQTLPAATIPKTPGLQQHARSSSSSETFAMPPPSERLLRIIIDGLPVQIFTAAPMTGRLTWVNSKLLQYRGLSAESILNEPWGGIHAEDMEEFLQGWSLSLHTGKQFQQKVRLRRYDDTYRYFYVRATPLRTNEQRIVHWFGTMFDLHDQHIAEVNASRQQETAASEAKYRALANSSPQIVFAVNPKRGVSFCNTQWTAYSGQTEEEAKGAGFMDHVYPDDLEKCKLPSFDGDGTASHNVPISVPPKPHRTSSRASSAESSDISGDTVTTPVVSSGMHMPQRKLSELATTGILRVSRDATGKPSYSTEVRLRSKSGEYRWHLVRVLLADPLIQSEAQEETWYGTCTDINDHKELEKTLKETMDAKSRFLSNMSHEIRTPLNGIWGMTNFLIDSNLNGEQLDQVNVIRSSTEGLRDLINDILDLSKVEAGMITLNMDWLNIRSVIEEVNDLTSSLALDKGIELNYLVHNNVPSVLKGDKFRFRQVLLNVIGNAIKFTEEGEVFVRCSVTSDPPDDPRENSTMILVEVKDTGTGFSESEAERLFKRFSQIDGSSTRQHGGSGLGLVISMQLVELHGGMMSATSAVGKGSSFSFTMQFGLPSVNDPPVNSPVSEPTVTPSEHREDKDVERPSLLRNAASASAQPSFGSDITGSPGIYHSLSPSSAGSEPSNQTVRSSLRSSRSSQSSRASLESTPMNLELRPDARFKPKADQRGSDSSSVGRSIPLDVPVQAPLYSILIVCPLPWMREATVGHLESILTKNVPHSITARVSLAEARDLLGGEEVVTFSHVVVAIPDTDATIELIDHIIQRSPSSTSVVVISDLKQRNDIAYRKTPQDFGQLAKEGRLQFVQKPVKPSKLAIIFDPAKSTELSTDQNQSSAQQIAINQKLLFEEMTRRLGDKDIRVLLVEDNPINQMVMLKLLQRVSIGVETVLDGVQATDKVLSKPPDYYSIILMDLMMPNKDGYETCHDIRAWERKNGYSPIPIVALSANVLDDVWRKCKDAGFNSYLTKPVEFKELSDAMIAFLDPEDPNKPISFMKSRTGAEVKPSRR